MRRLMGGLTGHRGNSWHAPARSAQGLDAAGRKNADRSRMTAPAAYCIGTCASLITPLQNLVSLVMKVFASAGVPLAARKVNFLKLSCVSGFLRISSIALLSLATIVAGVFGGAAMAFQVPDSKPFKPASSSVGMSERSGMRVMVATARMRAL